MFKFLDEETVIYLEKIVSRRRLQGQTRRSIIKELREDHDLPVSEAMIDKIYKRILNKTKHHLKSFHDPKFIRSISKKLSKGTITIQHVEHALLYVSSFEGKKLIITPKPTDFLFPSVEEWQVVNKVTEPDNKFWDVYEMKIWLEK